ncbi:MAG: hypothetical protein AAGE92_07650 [Cyanobacteria bacterium P01_G01_bin.4]
MSTFPVYKALDSNGDGEISTKEIENAAAALKKLDKNGDGVLTRDEIGPTMAGGQGRGMGRGGFGGGRPGGVGQGRGPGIGGPPSGQGGFPDPETIFEGRDKDDDGKISKDEAGERLQSRWADVDKDKDGVLNRKEQEAVIAELKERFGGAGQGQQRRPGAGGGAGAGGGRRNSADDKDQLGGVAPRRPGSRSTKQDGNSEEDNG